MAGTAGCETQMLLGRAGMLLFRIKHELELSLLPIRGCRGCERRPGLLPVFLRLLVISEAELVFEFLCFWLSKSRLTGFTFGLVNSCSATSGLVGDSGVKISLPTLI